MTKMTNLEHAKELYKQVGNGEILEAFEKNYAENIVMEEPRGKREGKNACREYEKQFVDSVKEFHGMTIKSMPEDSEESKVFIEIEMDITFKNDERVLMEQVAVQKWENNQIIHERFYYDS